MLLKYFPAALAFLTFGITTRGQNTAGFCDDNAYQVLQQFKGETIKVNCDTVYLLNKATFSLLYSSYTNYKHQNDSLTGFFTTADNYLYLYQQQVATQKEQLDTMQNYFHSLSDSSQRLVSSTVQSLQNINANLDSIEATVDSAKIKIAQAQKEIVKHERAKFLSHIAWGLGGLAIGAFIVAIVK
jgi:hypothetical protein